MLKLFNVLPQDFLHKLINVSKEALVNLFLICKQSCFIFLNRQISHLDPLVCENACHIRAFVLWQIFEKYERENRWHEWYEIIDKIDDMVVQIEQSYQFDEHTKQSFESYFLEKHLFVELDPDLFFDIKFVFLSHILTLTKKDYPSSNFMLCEKTDLHALEKFGLVHNKVKTLVASAQRDLSRMSCLSLKKSSYLFDKDVLQSLLTIRNDDHGRSFLPQYLTGKVIFNEVLNKRIPLILKINRFVNSIQHDQVVCGFIVNTSYQSFEYTTLLENTDSTLAIVCEGVVNYDFSAESSMSYLERLKKVSLLDVLLANFAAHPQFSGTLRNTECIYTEYKRLFPELIPKLIQEFDMFNEHNRLARTLGCSLNNPSLLFLNHIYCDAVSNYHFTAPV